MSAGIRPSIRHKAYLVAFLDVRPAMPQVTKVDIYSSPPTSLSLMPADGWPAQLLEVSSDESYQAARDLLLKTVRQIPSLHWVWPWVDPSEQAHRARYWFSFRQLPVPAAEQAEESSAER